MFGVQVQLQLFTKTARQVATHTHGQGFAGGGDDVAEGVAAQAFADIRGHAQRAIARLRQVQVLRTNPQGYRAADAQVGTAQWQADAGAGIQQHFTALAVQTGDLALEKTHFRRAEEPGDEQVGRLVIQLQR